PRVRGRPARRGALGRPARARVGAREDRPLLARHPAADCRAPSRDRPDDDPQPAVGRGPARAVLHASRYGRAHPPPARDAGRSDRTGVSARARARRDAADRDTDGRGPGDSGARTWRAPLARELLCAARAIEALAAGRSLPPALDEAIAAESA